MRTKRVRAFSHCQYFKLNKVEGDPGGQQYAVRAILILIYNFAVWLTDWLMARFGKCWTIRPSSMSFNKFIEFSASFDVRDLKIDFLCCPVAGRKPLSMFKVPKATDAGTTIFFGALLQLFPVHKLAKGFHAPFFFTRNCNPFDSYPFLMHSITCTRRQVIFKPKCICSVWRWQRGMAN